MKHFKSYSIAYPQKVTNGDQNSRLRKW